MVFLFMRWIAENIDENRHKKNIEKLRERKTKNDNDTPKKNIKYTNYTLIQMYINRLQITKQIFIAMDY